MAPKVGLLLPVSDRRGGDDGALLFKGSAMTMRGAFAALSYMTCAGCDATFLYIGIFLNTNLNSALTQTMCGKLKDLFTIGLG
ncbi:UDP-N-acetylglucosamine transporter UGNT1-like isoform X2 [Musa acuminata AAA Group]|uniref:UDP-N-acetylglucosamine transporter UGNT1-like isoform X2 n=1 Tax=Musa acuminata AAA Group TaxID=214697 RepID=UPI0031DD1EEC